MKTRILVVEDNENMLELLSRQLELLGYEVMVAKNGMEAVRAAGSQLPHLIVMDVVMPKMDGFEAVSEIRDNPETRDIPVLAATGWVSPTTREKYRASDFDDYIVKPFTHRDLQAAIAKLLRGSNANQVSDLPSLSTNKGK
jgi:two-component system response regulator MprA